MITETGSVLTVVEDIHMKKAKSVWPKARNVMITARLVIFHQFASLREEKSQTIKMKSMRFKRKEYLFALSLKFQPPGIKFKINENLIHFKIDTCTSINVIDEHTYSSMKNKP